jgi:glycosyltransferase involved in cell wall biosynthesis
MEPKVSFIVPCYNLAHFLADCVDSILSQTYGDFEVLIMDDCSPDNTPEVAAEFKDPRVIYIRNETNLGNIRNYNKGIELSRGRYIWLISADDRLRSPNVLQRYVNLLEKNPQVGYVFCPAITLRDNMEFEVEAWTAWPGDRDRILDGREVLRRSVINCPVCAPTGLARKECYTRISHFPLNLPRVGDFYLWSVFATVYDVGYLAEPMIYYRRHSTNMEQLMEKDQPSFFLQQDRLARWLIKKAVERAGFSDISSEFGRHLFDEYVSRLVQREVESSPNGLTWDDVKQEIQDNAADELEAEELLRLIRIALPTAMAIGYTRAGAGQYKIGQLDCAITAFRFATTKNPWSIKPRVYLVASRLEQLFGIRLIPWLKALRETLL